MKKITYILALIVFSTFVLSIQLKAQVTAELEWVKQFGGASSGRGISISVDDSGNVYTTGNFLGTADFDPGIGVYNLSSSKFNVFISKLDAKGNFIWAKQFEGNSINYAFTISVDVKCNVYVIGYFKETADFDPGSSTFNLTADSDTDIFISKLDSSGNFVWAKQLKGTFEISRYGIDVDTSGNVYATGNFMGTADFDPGVGTNNLTSHGEEDIFILKLDSTGNLVWAKRLGGPYWDRGVAISVDASGNVLTSGNFRGTVDFDPGIGVYNLTASDTDSFISKLDAYGNFLWAKQLGDYADFNCVDASGNVYTNGDFSGTDDFDPGTDTYYLNAGSRDDLFISKLDASGNFVWAKQMVVNAWGHVSMFVDASGNVYTTGEFSGAADFDPETGTYYFNATGFPDIFISKLDASGNFVWAKRVEGTGNDRDRDVISNAIFVDTWNNVYTTGGFYRTVDFDPDIGIFNLTSTGYDNVFIHKMSQNTSVIINENNRANNFIFYPNPTTGIANITLSEVSDVEISVYNNIGQKVKTVVNQSQIDLSDQREGIYFITIKTQKQILNGKIHKTE